MSKTFVLEFYSGILCLIIHSGLLWIIQFWIQTLCSFGFIFKIWGSETAERLVLINILRDSLDIKGIVI